MLNRQPTLLLMIALGLSGIVLGGCAGKVTPATRYLLPASAPADVPDTPRATLELKRPELAHYLDVEGIILQLDDITLNEARDHQWAEGLDQQLARSFQAQLAQNLPQWRVLSGRSGGDNTYSLRISVDQFQGHYDGHAVASGQWQLRNDQGRLIHMAGFRARTALENDGYPALVHALGESLETASADIAAAIRRAVL